MSRLTRAALAVLLLGAGGYGVYWWTTQDAQDADAEIIRIAFWNIRDLSANSRDDAERNQICEVLKKFDAIAICEVNDQQILDVIKSLDEAAKVGRVSDEPEYVGLRE